MPHRDRDSTSGDIFRGRGKAMGVMGFLIAPRSPWLGPYIERVIGSVRRDVLNHVVILGQRPLHRVLRSCFAYDHGARCQMALDGDAPEHRDVQPPAMGRVLAIPEVGGLYHRHERRAARPGRDRSRPFRRSTAAVACGPIALRGVPFAG